MLGEQLFFESGEADALFWVALSWFLEADRDRLEGVTGALLDPLVKACRGGEGTLNLEHDVGLENLRTSSLSY